MVKSLTIIALPAAHTPRMGGAVLIVVAHEAIEEGHAPCEGGIVSVGRSRPVAGRHIGKRTAAGKSWIGLSTIHQGGQLLDSRKPVW